MFLEETDTQSPPFLIFTSTPHPWAAGRQTTSLVTVTVMSSQLIVAEHRIQLDISATQDL
jgi:hypothetical protein